MQSNVAHVSEKESPAFRHGENVKNLFRQALEILSTKRGDEMTEEELQLVATATIPLMVRGCPFPEDMAVGECLEELAKMVEEEKAHEAR